MSLIGCHLSSRKAAFEMRGNIFLAGEMLKKFRPPIEGPLSTALTLSLMLLLSLSLSLVLLLSFALLLPFALPLPLPLLSQSEKMKLS